MINTVQHDAEQKEWVVSLTFYVSFNS
jgi:hypothetical protein